MNPYPYPNPDPNPNNPNNLLETIILLGYYVRIGCLTLLYYKTNIKLFSVLIYSYINTRGSWENSKLYENTPPFGRHVSIQFPNSTRVDITVYQHGKCFIFVKY